VVDFIDTYPGQPEIVVTEDGYRVWNLWTEPSIKPREAQQVPSKQALEDAVTADPVRFVAGREREARGDRRLLAALEAH
jgi:hypothetical protein